MSSAKWHVNSEEFSQLYCLFTGNVNVFPQVFALTLAPCKTLCSNNMEISIPQVGQSRNQ